MTDISSEESAKMEEGKETPAVAPAMPPAQSPAQVPAQAPRENMITTAIKFLQNPKVRESPFAQRRAFLEKKGLTSEEMELAIVRSGTQGDEQAVAPPTGQNVQMMAPPGGQNMQMMAPPGGGMPNQQMQLYRPPPPSVWQRLRDFMSSAIVVGGLSYAIYKFFKIYIAPHWFAESKQDKQLATLVKGIEELNNSMEELAKSMNITQINLGAISKSTALTKKTITDLLAANYVHRLCGELSGTGQWWHVGAASKQFPSVPNSKPVLPSWQLSTTPDSKSSPGTSTDSQAQAHEETKTHEEEPQDDKKEQLNGVQDAMNNAEEEVQAQSNSDLRSATQAQEDITNPSSEEAQSPPPPPQTKELHDVLNEERGTTGEEQQQHGKKVKFTNDVEEVNGLSSEPAMNGIEGQ